LPLGPSFGLGSIDDKGGPPQPRLSDGTRQELEDRLRDDVRRLRRYMGDDFDAWGFA
jgi:hypothetical protein